MSSQRSTSEQFRFVIGNQGYVIVVIDSALKNAEVGHTVPIFGVKIGLSVVEYCN